MITTLERSPERHEEPPEQLPHKLLPIKVTRLGAVATAALTSVTLAAAVSFCRVFPGWRYLLSLVFIALVMHGFGLWCRWRRWTLLPSVAVGVGLLAVILGWLCCSCRPAPPGTWHGATSPTR
jgi:hypothetical protein